MKEKLEKASTAISRLQEKVSSIKKEVGIPEKDLDTLFAIFIGFCSDLQDRFIRMAVSKVKQNIAEHLWHTDIHMEKAAEYVELRYILEELQRQENITAERKNCWFYQTVDIEETALVDFDLTRRYFVIEAPDQVRDEWDFWAEEIVADYPVFCVNTACFDSMDEIEKDFPGLVAQINRLGAEEAIQKSLERIPSAEKDGYPGLPDELKPFYHYIKDGETGHVVMAIPESLLEDAEKDGNLDDFECPFPCKYVLHVGFRMVQGHVVCKGDYDPNLGLMLDERWYEV